MVLCLIPRFDEFVFWIIFSLVCKQTVVGSFSSRFSQWSRGKVAPKLWERYRGRATSFVEATDGAVWVPGKPSLWCIGYRSSNCWVPGKLSLWCIGHEKNWSWGSYFKTSDIVGKTQLPLPSTWVPWNDATLLLPHAISKVTVGSNPTLVEFKGRSDMMIKVPLTGGPCAFDGKNLRWAWCGHSTVQPFSWAESQSVVTQVGAQFHRPVRDRKTFGASTGIWMDMEWQRCYYSKSFGCKVLPFSNHHLRVLEGALLNEVWRKPCFHHRRILAAGSLKRRGIGLSTKVPRHQWLLAGGGLASWHCCGWYSEQRCSRDARFCKTGQNNGWSREDNTTSYQFFQELPSPIC